MVRMKTETSSKGEHNLATTDILVNGFSVYLYAPITSFKNVWEALLVLLSKSPMDFTLQPAGEI